MKVKITTWAIRLLIGLLMLLATAYAIRSVLLPARTAGLFLDYVEGADWVPAPQNSLFDGGNIEFAGYDPVQLAGPDMGEWEEMVIVSFSRDDLYEDFLTRIEAYQDLSRYHLSLFAPGYEQRIFANWMLRRDRRNDSINVDDRATIEEAIPANPHYVDRWQDIFAGAYRGELVLLNFVSLKKDMGDAEAGEKAEELEKQYSKPTMRILGRMGAQLAAVGRVEKVVVGPEPRQHDEYGFGHYPSVDAFEVVFTARGRLALAPTRNRAMNAGLSAGYWLKPYAPFKLTAKNP
ncbi:MAG: hypothetical protein CME47_09710 [Halieaceae bacterium]|nr:hypothetical protein [Halieaceae bacterium]